MLGLFIAIRNFIIALLLALVGITFSPPQDDPETGNERPEEQSQSAPEAFFKIG